MTPRSPTRMLARHCDRYVVTLASPGGAIVIAPYVLLGRGPGSVRPERADGCEKPVNGRSEACDVRFEDPLYPAPH